MSANVVEKLPDFIQGILQSPGTVNVELLEQGLDASKVAFDPPVTPGGTNWDCLLTNSGEFQKRSKHRAIENGFVVASDGVGFAELSNGKTQMPDQSPAAFVQNHHKSRANARSVVDSTKNSALSALTLTYKCQVKPPDSVDLGRSWSFVAQLARDIEQ